MESEHCSKSSERGVDMQRITNDSLVGTRLDSWDERSVWEKGTGNDLERQNLTAGDDVEESEKSRSSVLKFRDFFKLHQGETNGHHERPCEL
eukprot:751225-Prorocentrum_minimum.AAC.3